MSEINLIGALFFRAVFFSENTTPVIDVTSIANKKIPFGIDRFLEVSVDCFYGGKEISEFDTYVQIDHCNWNIFYNPVVLIEEVYDQASEKTSISFGTKQNFLASKLLQHKFKNNYKNRELNK